MLDPLTSNRGGLMPGCQMECSFLDLPILLNADNKFLIVLEVFLFPNESLPHLNTPLGRGWQYPGP